MGEAFSDCRNCGVDIGRAWNGQRWHYFRLSDGSATCKQPGTHGDAMIDGAGQPVFHEPNLPTDMSREGVEKWLER